MVIVAFFYYEQEYSKLQNSCNMEMRNAGIKIKSDILEAKSKNMPYEFEDYIYSEEFQYAIVDDNHQYIFSELDKKPQNLNKKIYQNNKSSYLVLPIKQNTIKHIIVEDTKLFNTLIVILIIQTVAVFILVFIFISFIGYILTQILLRPLKSKHHRLKEFINNASHEINTPVSAIIMTLPALKKKLGEDKKIFNHISISIKNIKQIYDKLVFHLYEDNFNTYKEVFDIKKILLKQIDFFEEVANHKNIKIIHNIDLAILKMDKYQCSMLISNIISNAIKYSKQNTKITISFANNILSIKDEGYGISKDVQKDVFKKYTRGEEKIDGFGLGLYIVKSICDFYKMQISFSSTPNIGTEFIIDFSPVKITKH